MNHARAKRLFEEIQARPYSLSRHSGEVSNNCYFKGIELLQKLGVMGYAVRGRVGETFWDPKIFPPDVMSLLPDDLLTTHFFMEILGDDGVWRALDPSFQKDLARYGLTVGSWENGEICFPITRLYTQEESLKYQELWFDPAYQEDFFRRAGPLWRALNEWFEKA